MSHAQPKVSIVLPVLNGKSHLRRCVESCLNQTHRNIELLIVDDGSTDETSEIIKSFKDERIKHLRLKKNYNLPNALNAGFAEAQGEFLTWTSDANSYLPTAIEELVAFLEKNRDVDFVYADYYAHYLEIHYQELRNLPNPQHITEENCVGCCFLYTRRVYETIGNYDPRYDLVEDYDYWIKVFRRFNAKHYPKALCVYVECSKSLMEITKVSTFLAEAVLKYENRYSSFAEFMHSLQRYLRTSSRQASRGPSAAVKLFQNIVRISRLSFSLCLTCLTLMIRFLLVDAVSVTMSSLFVRPLEYFDFQFLFKPKISRLENVKQKKNVLCIIPSLVVGGAEKVVLNVARGTDRDRYNFHLISAYPSGQIWRNDFESFFGNVITSFDKIGSISYPGKRYGYFHFLIKKLNIDALLITTAPVAYCYIPRLKSDFRNLKIIDLIHSKLWPPIRMLKSAAPFVDKRICISHNVKNHLIQEYRRSGMDEGLIDKIVVIHNGIDTKEFNADSSKQMAFKEKYSIPKNTKIISFIGRFVDEKNPLLFVEIAKHLLAHANADLKFVMAGDGPDFAKVKKFIKSYGLEDHFVLTGEIDNVSELLGDTYVLWVVSKREGIPLVILEAMSMGVPVMSINVGEISEVVEDGVTGFLIEPNKYSVGSFTSKMLNLLDGKINYSILAQKSREKILASFALETMGSNYQRIFDELLGVKQGQST